jgi:hypothetical protein
VLKGIEAQERCRLAASAAKSARWDQEILWRKAKLEQSSRRVLSNGFVVARFGKTAGPEERAAGQVGSRNQCPRYRSGE